jgi:predicted dienelactone hydrolase
MMRWNLARVGATATLCVLVACGGQKSAATPDDVADAADDASAVDAASIDTGADTTSTSPLAWPVAQNGPYACGLRTVQLTYKLPGTLGERTVPLFIWYPATQGVGEHPSYLGAFDDPNAWVDAPLAPSVYAGGYPILVHSHGFEGFAGNSAVFMCHLASHGWVALAPEHVGNTLIDTPTPLPLLNWLHRPLDISAALDWAKTPPSGDPLVGKLDMAHIGMSGHSFGTYTVWASAGATFDTAKIATDCKNNRWPDCTPALIAAFSGKLSDDRPLTFINLAGDGSDLLPPSGKNAVKRPVLQMNGTLNDSGETGLFADVTGVDLTWVDVQGGCHQLYGLGNTINGGPECKVLDDQAGFALVKPWFLAWVRYHVLGDRGAEVTGIVNGTTSVSPLIAFQHKMPK